MSDAEDRLVQAVIIIAAPWNYKICEGCDSIVTIQTRICPNCKSYRFNDDIETIKAHASKIAKEEQKTVTEEDLFS